MIKSTAEEEALEKDGQRDGSVPQTTGGGVQVTPSPSHPQKQPCSGKASTPYAGKGRQPEVLMTSTPETEKEEILTARLGGLATNEELLRSDCEGRHSRESDGTYDTL